MSGELAVERGGRGALGRGEGARDGGEGGRLEAAHGRLKHRVVHGHQTGDERVEGARDVDRAAELKGLSGEREGLLLDVAGQTRANGRFDVAGGATDQVDGVFVRAVDEPVGVVDQAVVGRGDRAGVDGGRTDHEVAGFAVQVDDRLRRGGQEVGRDQGRVGDRRAHALEEHEAATVVG